MRIGILILLCLSACRPGGWTEGGEMVPPSLIDDGDDDETTELREEESALAGCQGRKLGDGGYDIRCDSFEIEVERATRPSADEALEAYVQTHVFGAQEEGEAEATVKSYSLSVGGKRHPGRSYNWRDQAAPERASAGYVVVVEGEGGLISIACKRVGARAQDRDLEGQCRKAMLEIVRFGVPARFSGS